MTNNDNKLAQSITTDVFRSILKEELQGFPTKDELKNELKNFATKDDLKNFPTKDDLKNELKSFASKDDLKNELKNFATKDDLKDGLRSTESRMLARMRSYQEVNIQHHLETKAAIGTLNQRHIALKEGLHKAAQ